jgi:hypothetical protein
MEPHANNLHDFLFFQDLIDQPMLDIDAARVCAIEIAHQLFKWRRVSQGPARISSNASAFARGPAAAICFAPAGDALPPRR